MISPALLLTAALRAYQWTIRPLIPGACRFEPGCSEYAVQAVREHGAARGSVLAAWRVLRCNPFCDGGYDPVPPCGCQ
ncbi:MAG: membrane protein insertion efficiency factor YidD, partial [Janthinobacterium lividum]